MLLVLGGVFVLGAGSCAVLGGLVFLGARAEDASGKDDPASAQGSGSSGVAKPSDPAGQPSEDPTDPTTLGPSTDDDEPGGSAPGQAASAGKTPSSAATGTTGPSATGGSAWFCNATGWVRTCGFANVCNNKMVSGSGIGPDRGTASMTAQTACQGMIRANGGAGVCTVACSPVKKK